ncbi:MAG: hypothetical protein WCX73_04645 [Candidatus Pacearchaeota archaeon]|jgi:hypothetical protein
MYFILKKKVLRNILFQAFAKSGNIRNLEKELKISKSTLSLYYNEKRAIRQENLNKLLNYLGILIKEGDIIKKLPDNWKQIEGGKKCVEIKKKNGVYIKQLKKCQKASSKYMKFLHEKMKKENPEKYHIAQYEKFKKIGGYKFITINGEKVRNNLEKDTADLLNNLKIEYKYEPLVKSGGKYFFPDFLINNELIIECTEWRGFDKAIKLRDKIKHLKKKYRVYVVIPKALKRYYGILNSYLLLGLDDLKQILQKSG